MSTAAPVMDIHQILKQLPHRYPILLVDRVLEIEKGVRIKALKNVTINEEFFQGHFPQEHVMPGVLIIEALAQTGAVCILSVEANKGKTAYFAGINKARFKTKVKPGDVLTLEVEIIKSKASIGIGSAIAKIGDKVAVEAELMFAIG